MLKPSQVASLMGVDIRTVQRRAKSGSLTCEIQSNAKNRPEYIFPLSTLPKHVQERYYTRHTHVSAQPCGQGGEMLPLRPHDQQGHKAVHEHGTPGAG